MAKAESTVTYRLLPDDAGYRVGTDGSVWSCLGRRGSFAYVPTDNWFRLKACPTSKGYLSVSIRGQVFSVHTLVLTVFVGPCPDGCEGCHEDDNKNNNALANLRWDTKQANMADADRNGLIARGEKHKNSKVTAEVVRALRTRHEAGGVTYAQLGREYHITKEQVANICQRKHWTHIL